MFPSWFNPLWVKNPPTLDDLEGHRLSATDARLLTPAEHTIVRNVCQTSLRFLVNCVLRPASKKFLSLNERTHGPIFDSFLVPNPDAPWDEWSEIKERVSLAFRGALKSTIVGAFLTQVILCDPDIRILVLSGKLIHAKTITGLGRQPFVSNGALKILFPENSIEENENTGDTFVAKARNKELNLRDPTLAIGTFDSVKAGGHYELLVFDDCTNEINCATPELVEKNEQHYDDTEGLIEPGGYRHFFGTRWAPDETDLPEVIRMRGLEHMAEHHGEKNTTYVSVPVWSLKFPDDPAVIDRDKRNKLLTDDVILTWPEKLTAKFLWPKYRSNPIKFNGQYLLRWRGVFLTDSFNRDLLDRAVRPFADGMPLPHDRFLVINFDMGGIFSGRRSKSSFDYSCGIAAMFECTTRRMFVYDSFLEVFGSSTDAATTMVEFYRRQLLIGPVGRCSIEDSNGIRMLEGELNSTAKAAGVPLNLVWEATDNTENSKNIAISMTCGPIKKCQIEFSTTLPYREEIFKMYENWSPQPGLRRKDDGPDCIAQIWKRCHGLIFPYMVSSMQSSGQEFSYEPEAVQELDPHAGERENADFALLQSMTVQHAS